MTSKTNQEHVNPALAALEDEVSLVDILAAILRNWRILAVLPLTMAITVGLWSFSMDRSYAATASFVPTTADGRSGGGAAALAQQFGVSLASDRGAQSPQFYVELLQSHAVLRQAVESEYDMPDEDGGVRRANLIDLFGVDPHSDAIPPWRRAAHMLRDKISASFTWETSVVQLQVSASHPVLAEQIAEQLLKILNQFHTEVRQERANEEGRFISERLADAQADLVAAEGILQNFLRHNRDFRNSPELIFEHDRFQRQVAMRQEVYTSLMRSQEQVRIDAVRDTPLLVIIDDPIGSAEPVSRGTVMRAIMAFILGTMLAIFVAFIREFTRRRRELNDPEFVEFQGLVRETLADLRQPRRWLGRSDKVAATEDT